jgi:hypothetical protein
MNRDTLADISCSRSSLKKWDRCESNSIRPILIGELDTRRTLLTSFVGVAAKTTWDR